MSHQESVEAGEVGVVAFPDDAVEGPLGLVGGLVCQLDGEAVECIEVVAGDQGTAVQVPEVFYAADLLDDELFVPDEVVDQLVGELEGDFGLCLLPDAPVEVVDVIRHEHGCGRVVLHILVEAAGALVLLDLLQDGDPVGGVAPVHDADVVVFLVGLPDGEVEQVGVAFLVPGLLLVGIAVEVIEDVIVDPCHLGVGIEDVGMGAGLVVPGLVEHDVVQDLGFLYGIGDLAEDLGVPSLVEEEDVVLAEQVEIVLVLGDDAVVDLQRLDEPVQDVALAEFVAVQKQDPRVEVEVAVEAQAFLDICSVLVHLDHGLLVAGAQDEAGHIGVEEVGHVAADDGVAVDVDGLVVFRMHVGYEEPEVCCLGIVVPKRELVRYGLQVGRDVLEFDLEAGALQHRPDLGLALVGHVGVEEIDPVCAVALGVLP